MRNMKHPLFILVFIYLLSGSLKTQAQDFYISFAATGSSSTLERIKVDNLTSGDSVTLIGGVVLRDPWYPDLDGGKPECRNYD
jgi:hypothetical protein